MIRKQDVIKMLAEWIDRLDESSVSEAIECVLLMVKNKIDNMPEQNVWIPVSERLPEEKINSFTQDYYYYPVMATICQHRSIRYYQFGNGHWWHGRTWVDEYVTHWMDIQPHKESQWQQSEDWKESMMGHFTKIE